MLKYQHIYIDQAFSIWYNTYRKRKRDVFSMTEFVINNIELLDTYTLIPTIIVGSDINAGIFDNVDPEHIIDSFEPHTLQHLIMDHIDNATVVILQPVKEADDLSAVHMALALDMSCTFVLDADVDGDGDKDDVLHAIADMIGGVGELSESSDVMADLNVVFNDRLGQVVRYVDGSLIEL